MCGHPDKVQYLSRMLADNAVTLHQFAHPGCALIVAYQCDDHWHIGHRRRGRKVCPPGPLWRRRQQAEAPS